MKVGDRVRVTQSIVVYHHPEHRNQAFDIKNLEGKIVEVIKDWHGRPISPNLPVYVEFPAEKKSFKAHLKGDEIEVLGS
ncbi:MAG: ferredoxin--nitrite reductase [Cyanothece sp. SIO1E1]|nr:ferredoxin--nitrite reductase [Cyanothece sp. SIO1E1]